MPPNRDLAYIRHMLDFSRQAVAFTHKRRRADLDADAMLALALTRLIELIGEAARKVTPGLCAKHPEIPWQQIVGTRDRLAHGYIEIDYDIIWRIVTADLPQLIKQLEKLLAAKKDVENG
jgi:uncharacterized protein with HEPN domain